ncbi:MAG: DNA primase [Chloroflexi bacterium]|nr:DNA primase [Chloroflexota bacterium]
MGVADEVRQRLDIVEVVSQYVPLQKAGRHFKACCPFHSERTPSFIVAPERQTWHCFGACSTGGDVFSFLMKAERLEFGEALRRLAQRAGVTLVPSKEEAQAQKKTEHLYRLNEAAAQYYHDLLLRSPAAERARSYLQGRGISPETVSRFQLGYSLEAWQALREHLQPEGFPPEDMVAAGLAVPRQGGGSYDLFRGRLLFPICTPQGRVAGFGGRALDDSTPKYLNTPQTAVFDKGAVLYGIDRAAATVKSANQAVIVEGYFDVLMAHQRGFSNVVASMGTSLTERQIAILRKLTRNLVLALDADAAGDEATLRAIVTVGQALGKAIVPVPTSSGIRYQTTYHGEVRVASLPRGKDPDEVLAEGGDAWATLVNTSQTVVEYIFTATTNKMDLTQLSGRQGAAEKLLPIISELSDPVLQGHYLQRLARLVAVPETTLRSALPRPRAPKRPGEVRVPEIVPQKQRLEEFCLSLLLRYPELRTVAAGLEPEDFSCTENREVFRLWQQGLCSSQDIATSEHLAIQLRALQGLESPSMSPRERDASLAQAARRLRERRLRDMKMEEAAWLEEEAEVPWAELESRTLPVNMQLRQIFSQHAKEDNRKGVDASHG